MPPSRVFVLALLAAATVAATATGAARWPPRSVQQPVLHQILRAFPESRISGRVGAPTRDWGRRRHASFAQSTWLYFEIRAGSSVEYVKQGWQADVAEGLLAGISRSRGWRPVTGQTITVVYPDGRKRFDSASIHGDAFRGGIHHASEAEAEHELRESAAGVGAGALSVRFPRPLGRLAVEVVTATDRPEAFADPSLQRVWEIARPLVRRAEGVYVEVRALDGRWVAALGTSVRTSSTISVVNSAFR